MVKANVIVPAIEEIRLQFYLRHQYEIWRRGKDATLPSFEIKNINFIHDSNWKEKFWSIQSAHDGNHAGWIIVKYTFEAAMLAPYIVNLVQKF